MASPVRAALGRVGPGPAGPGEYLLSLAQWRACTLVGAASLPVGYLLKLIPAADRELHAIIPGAVAAHPVDEMEKLHRGMERAVSGGVVSPMPEGSDSEVAGVPPPRTSPRRRARV